MAIDDDEFGTQINIVISGQKLAPEDLADEIRSLAREHIEKPARVRLVTRVGAGTELD